MPPPGPPGGGPPSRGSGRPPRALRTSRPAPDRTGTGRGRSRSRRRARALTVPEGTSDRNAIGRRDHEREQRARSHLLGRALRSRRRTRRTPAPPATIADSQSAKRPQSSEQEERQAGEHQQRHQQRRRRSPSRTFSASRAERPTSPRVSRGKAFSSRSSASEPATSRTVTNISVSVAATAIANVSSDGRVALDDLLVDADRLRDRAQQRQREVEVLAREVAEARSPRRAVRSLPGGGTRSAQRLQRLARALEPEDLDFLAEEAERRRPRAGVAGRSSACAETCWEISRFASVISAWIRSSTSCALIGSSSFTSTSTVGCSRIRATASDSRSSIKVGRAGSARRAPRRRRPAARPPPWTTTSMHSTRSQSSVLAPPRSKSSPPSCSGVGGGTSFRNATRGLSGRESAKPIRTAIAIG